MTETDKKPTPANDMPPAGPHSKPELTDKNKTPGSGLMQDQKDDGDNANDAPSG